MGKEGKFDLKLAETPCTDDNEDPELLVDNKLGKVSLLWSRELQINILFWKCGLPELSLPL